MSHTFKTSLLGIMITFCPFLKVLAQIPVDGFYPKKNTITVAPSYSYKNYDQFYRGQELSEGTPAGLGEISSSIFAIYGAYAITDWLSSTINLPYISVESEEDVLDPIQQVSKVDGLQDLGVYLKARGFQKKFQNDAQLSVGGATGVTFPIGDYEGAGVLSLGNQATTINGSAIVQYALPFKIFSEVQLGYSLRNSSEFDVPNAMMYSAKIGFHNEFLYVHAKLDVQNSMSGLDIGSPEFAAAGAAAILPETEVDFTNLSFNFFVPVYKNYIGVSAGYGTTLDGRNYNKEDAISFGLVYTAN